MTSPPETANGPPRPAGPGARDRPPDLSVVIVSYECRDLLARCLDSLPAAADELTCEVLVVDNASSDGTPRLLRQDPRVRALCNPDNRGFARATNQGIRASRGRYVLLLNPDTVAGESAFRRTLESLESDGRLAAATCRVVRPDGSLDPSCKREFPSVWDAVARFSGLSRLFPRSRLFARYDARHLPDDVRQTVPLIDGCFMMIRRAALEDIGLLDERFFMYAEEMDWCRRAAAKGWRIGYEPDGRVVHLKGEITRHHTFRMLWHFHRSMALYCWKYRRRWDPSIAVILPGIAGRFLALTVLNAVRKERRVSG